MVNQLSVLHINNSYGGTKVYQNLYKNLDLLGLKQVVYIPLNFNNKSRVNNQTGYFTNQYSKIVYSTELKIYHRYLFKLKIQSILGSIQKEELNLRGFNLIHATTICADGSVAYELWKKHNIPYILNVRGTDVEVYFKKMFWLRNYFIEVLIHAKHIIFLSAALRKRLLDNYISDRSTKYIIENKSIVLPNGVDNLFLAKKNQVFGELENPIRLLYVGGIQENKNITSIIAAVETLNLKNRNIELTLVGFKLAGRRTDSTYLKRVKNLIDKYEWIHAKRAIPPEKLLKVYKDHDIFVMPSFSETFGLVYIEALSQGLPVIYSHNQGIDGYFKDGQVGFSVNPHSIGDIADKIDKVISNYADIKASISQIDFEKFKWSEIAKEYINIYKQSISK